MRTLDLTRWDSTDETARNAGEARLVKIEDRNAAIETVRREKATKEPGSIGASMSGVVVEIRVKEGQDVKAGDPYAPLSPPTAVRDLSLTRTIPPSQRGGHERHEDGVERLLPRLGQGQARGRPGRRLSRPGRPYSRDCALLGDRERMDGDGYFVPRTDLTSGFVNLNPKLYLLIAQRDWKRRTLG